MFKARGRMTHVVAIGALLFLTGCDRIYDIFLDFVGLWKEKPDLICIMQMPPLYRTQSAADDWQAREVERFAVEFFEVLEGELQRRAGDRGPISEKKYFLVRQSATMPPIPRCPMTAGGTVHVNAPYLDCIVEWGRIKQKELTGLCGPRAAYFSAGLEIESYADLDHLLVTTRLVNVESNSTATTPGRSNKIVTPVPRTKYRNRWEMLTVTAQESALATAKTIQREAETIQANRPR